MDQVNKPSPGPAVTCEVPSSGGFPVNSRPHEFPTHRERPGERVGPYELVEECGAGAFGTVWRAVRREPFEQQVAVKIVKPGMDSDAVLARFDQERRALAAMDHPNIARVFDGGITPRGRPYFVMEFVDGRPIDEFCREQGAELRTRASLLAQACDAVQHAHTKGVIHRDLKPGNVLVRRGPDGAPQAKVIDFGIAKAFGADLGRGVTELGQVMGTPGYRSPEQEDLDAPEPDTRTDVWALGALLRELAASAPDLRSATGAAELSWIPVRAMRHEPDDRYQSPAALGRDIRAWLSGGRLEAGPESVAYRLRSYARTHRVQAISASAVAASLLAATLLSSWFAWRESRARAESDRRAEEARRIVALQAEVVSRIAPNFVGAAVVQDVLNRHRDALVRAEPDREVRKKVLAEVFREVMRVSKADIGNDVLDRWFVTPTEQAVERELADVPAAAAAMHHELAQHRWTLGQLDRATALADRSLSFRRAAFGDRAPETLSTIHLRGMIALSAGENGQATEFLREAWDGRQAEFGPDHPVALESGAQLATALLAAGRPDDAERLLQSVLASQTRTFGAESAEAAGTMRELGWVLSGLGRHDAALPLLRQAWQVRARTIGPDAPGTVRAQGMLAVAMAEAGDRDAALPLLDDAHARSIRAYGTDEAFTVWLRSKQQELRQPAADTPSP